MEKKTKEKKISKTDLTEKKKISMAFEAQQECALIVLLYNEGYDFVFQVPRKKSEICQFLNIISLKKGDQEYQLEKEIERLVKNADKEIDENEIHSVKYERRNLMSATFNFLVELMESHDCHFSLKGTKGANITLKMLKITGLIHKQIDWKEEDIRMIGTEMNKRIKHYFQGEKRETPVEIRRDMIKFDDLISGEFDPHQMEESTQQTEMTMKPNKKRKSETKRGERMNKIMKRASVPKAMEMDNSDEDTVDELIENGMELDRQTRGMGSIHHVDDLPMPTNQHYRDNDHMSMNTMKDLMSMNDHNDFEGEDMERDFPDIPLFDEMIMGRERDLENHRRPFAPPLTDVKTFDGLTFDTNMPSQTNESLDSKDGHDIKKEEKKEETFNFKTMTQSDSGIIKNLHASSLMISDDGFLQKGLI